MWASNDNCADMLFHKSSYNDRSTKEAENSKNHHEDRHCSGASPPDPYTREIELSHHLSSVHHHHYHKNHFDSQGTMEDFGIPQDDSNTNLHYLTHDQHPYHDDHHHDHLYSHQHHDHLPHESSQLHQRHYRHPRPQLFHPQIQTLNRFETRNIFRKSPSGKHSNYVRTFCVTILFSLIFLSSHLENGTGVAALSCASCDIELCPDTSGCPGGLVTDICGCCQVCAKAENESCGGAFGIRGKCDRNLQCFIRPEVGKSVTGSEEGICKEVRVFRCESKNCPPVFEQLSCPRDSNLVTFAREIRVLDNNIRRTSSPNFTPFNRQTAPPNVTPIHSSATNVNNSVSRNSLQINHISSESSNSTFDNNVSSSEILPKSPLSSTSALGEKSKRLETVPDKMSYCVCNTSRCTTPVCAPGFTPVITRNATGFPGSCCDIYTCNKTKGCDPVICPPLDETPCPGDSIQLPNIWTEDNCCELQQGCSCPSSDRCEPIRCPSGFQVQIIARGTGLPGSCCDKFRCIDESGLTCRYDGKEMKNGEKWNIDKCRSCECKDGLNRCRDKTCSKLSCLWIVIPEDECCPVCRGCISESGNFYNNSDVWKENDCTTCKCKEGQVECQAESCALHCTNPVQIPGQCCPVCPDTDTNIPSTTTTSLICPSIDTCNLECSAGLELSPHGCYMCKCKKEKCLLDCPHGFKIDFEGNTLCECQAPEALCPHFDEDECNKHCEYGFKRNRDGCIKCKCNRCPPFNCTKRCLHGLRVNDEGCTICRCKEDTTPELIGPPKVGSNTGTEFIDSDFSCFSRYGIYHENGESWNDGCRTCYCHKGVEMCSVIACRAPFCSNPVFKVGDCCPSCPGLTIPSPNGDKLLCQSTNGDYYVEGQTWKMDPCTRCVCHIGSILCESMSCPPVLCHHPVKPKNQCCPICKGEDFSHLPPSPLHRKCKSPSGMLYKHREVWRSTPCQTCVCQDGQFHCYNQMCAPVKCNKTILRKDQCCPTCAELETKRPKICSYNNEFYDTEEKWEGNNCTQCICSNERVHCFPLSCPALKCPVMVRKRGHCCPTCYEMPSQGKEHDEKYYNTTASTIMEKTGQAHYVGMIILGVILFGFACIIIYLVYRLYLRQKHNFRETCAASNDELQGQTFLPHTENKDIEIDIKQPALQKLYYSSLTDKGTEERAFNTYTDLNFCDQNKNSAPIFKGC